MSTFFLTATLLMFSPSSRKVCASLVSNAASLTYSGLQLLAKKSVEIITKPFTFFSPMFWALTASIASFLLISQCQKLELMDISNSVESKEKNEIDERSNVVKKEKDELEEMFSFCHLLSDQSKETLRKIVSQYKDKELLSLTKVLNQFFGSMERKMQAMGIDFENNQYEIEKLMKTLFSASKNARVFKIQLATKNIEKIDSSEKFFEKIISWIASFQSKL